MRLSRRKPQTDATKACTRNTCCTDNPGAKSTAACFNVGACGCQVVSHPSHQTADYLKGVEVMSTPDRLALEGVVVEVDRTRLPQAMVESTTEYDYPELPEDLRRRLEDWCAEFHTWAST